MKKMFGVKDILHRTNMEKYMRMTMVKHHFLQYVRSRGNAQNYMKTMKNKTTKSSLDNFIEFAKQEYGYDILLYENAERDMFEKIFGAKEKTIK